MMLAKASELHKNKWAPKMQSMVERHRHEISGVLLVCLILMSVATIHAIYRFEGNDQSERDKAGDYREMVSDFFLLTAETPQLLLDSKGAVEYTNLAADRLGLAKFDGTALLDFLKVKSASKVKALMSHPSETASLKTKVLSVDGDVAREGTLRIQPKRDADGQWKYWVILQVNDPPATSAEAGPDGQS